MKKLFITVTAVLTVLLLSSCTHPDVKPSDNTDVSPSTEENNKGVIEYSPVDEGFEAKADIIACVMVKGELYYDTGRSSSVKYRCGVMDGSIDSDIGENKLPQKDNQSNFGTGYGYQYGPREGTIEVLLGDEWRVFATESVRKEILSEHKDTSLNDSTIAVTHNTVCEIGKGSMKTAVEISDEDASALWEILTVGTWDESGTSDCLSNISLNLGGHLYQYHSDCGTFNKYDLGSLSYYSSQLPDDLGKSLKLTEEERITVNGILEKYVSLSTDATNAFN